ncbi:MAG: phosphopantothenoylcysteine decarboxylase [Phycisphaerales bacterium]|nr:phosphopantothenoylcysteine decarboxylase [Phycisphaerales bacterium]
MTPTGLHDAPRLLITAGPTHEPIDAVRFIGNRSSGRLGVALADEASRRGWPVRLLLGPTHLQPEHPRVVVDRYRTASDLGVLLAMAQSECDILIMAAAVADYRPRVDPGQLGTKLKREAGTRSIELEPTEDLLAACSGRRAPGQYLVGFALEPRERLRSSAEEKLRRKSIDLIVANPLETMESGEIEATLVARDGTVATTDGLMPKSRFAPWLLDRAAAAWSRAVSPATAD